MKKLLCFFFFLFISTLMIFGQELIIAVSDFTVESRNPSYEFLGKGISRLVASELRKSGKVRLVEREKMNKILAEQELSLSDLMDETKQVRIGKLLSAKYLVVGEIIDMGPTGVLVSVRMVNVETGEVAWQDEKQEKLAVYDYMGAYFAKSLLDPLNVRASETTIAKIETKVEKAPEAIIKTSEGIDAYDKKETEVAKKKLEEAKAIDPANEVAAEYLAKLVVNTAKFKILTEMYFPNTNPAHLGIIQYDKLEVSGSFPGSAFYLPPSIFLTTTEYQLSEGDVRGNVGYQFPIGESMGMDIEVMVPYYLNNFYYSYIATLGDQNALRDFGGIIGFGWAPLYTFSTGIAISLYYQDRLRGVPLVVTDSFFRQALTLGLLFRDEDSSIIFDFLIGYPFDRLIYVNPSDGSIREVQAPLFIESTLTLAFAERSFFIILKQLNDLAFDRTYYCGRILAAMEWWPTAWFSFHVSGEGMLSLLEANTQFGFGINGGVTFRIPGSGWDFDIGYSYRQRPSRNIGGALFYDYIVKIGISKTGILTSR